MEEIACHAGGIHRLELLAELGEQGFGRQLGEHGVVALVRGEDIGIGSHGGEAIDCEITLATTRLTGGLGGVECMPGGVRLQSSSICLEPALVSTRIDVSSISSSNAKW